MYNPVETIVVDKKGAVVRFNESVSKMRRRVPNPGDIMYKDFAAGHSVDMYSVLHNCMKTGATKIIPESRYNATYFSITIAPFEKGAIIAAIDITRRKMAIEQITALNRVFENLGTNPEDNINYIVNRTKSILKSFCAIYIQMDGNDNIVCINSSKNTPDDILEQADSLKNLYFTPNNKELNKAIIIDNLKHTNVYWEIPELKKYDFKSMLGFPIIKNGKHVGSLCIIDTVFRKFSNNDIYTISTLAKAIAISEDRKIDKLNIIQSLSEKEILLKEVHHRVKNNIQIISSLLRLQSHHVENQEILHILKDSQNRVKAMALVHEKLYKSHDLAHIDFLDYIQSLLINLFSSLNVNSSHINFNTDIEEISLNIDTAIPLGLIISELVTNSIKYAFPEERKGTIAISLHRKEESFLINVSDNGIGFQNDTNPMDSQTLGLQLISALAKQLHGNFEFNTQSGTEFTMMFSEK